MWWRPKGAEHHNICRKMFVVAVEGAAHQNIYIKQLKLSILINNFFGITNDFNLSLTSGCCNAENRKREIWLSIFSRADSNHSNDEKTGMGECS